jgi:hypothetical protein
MAVKTPDYIIKGGTRTSSGAGGGLTYAEKPMGTLNGVNTVFTLTYSPVNLPSIWLELNGVWQQPPATGVTSPDYTISGNTITYAVAPASTDSHFIIYFIGSAAGTARGFGTTLGRASTDRVAWGNDAIFKVTGDLSFFCWVKFGNTTGTIVFQGNDSNSGSAFNDLYELRAANASGNNIQFVYNHENGSANANTKTFSQIFTTGQWYCAGFSRNTATKVLSFYVGTSPQTMVLIDTFAYTNNPDGGQDSGTQLIVGNTYSSFTHVLNGAVKEYYLWNRTTTLSELIAAASGTPSASGMFMGCRTGQSPEVDISGNDHVGTVTGTALVQGH